MTFRSYLLAGVAAVIISGSLVPATSGIMLLARAVAKTATVVSDQVVDRSNKGNRLTVSREAGRNPAPATVESNRAMSPGDPGRDTTIVAKRPEAGDVPGSIPVKTVTIRRSEPPKPVVQKRPLGCDPLFSPATTPALKHLFGRCIT
jgi:hypothetical protein